MDRIEALHAGQHGGIALEPGIAAECPVGVALERVFDIAQPLMLHEAWCLGICPDSLAGILYFGETLRLRARFSLGLLLDVEGRKGRQGNDESCRAHGCKPGASNVCTLLLARFC